MMLPLVNDRNLDPPPFLAHPLQTICNDVHPYLKVVSIFDTLHHVPPDQCHRCHRPLVEIDFPSPPPPPSSSPSPPSSPPSPLVVVSRGAIFFPGRTSFQCMLVDDLNEFSHDF